MRTHLLACLGLGLTLCASAARADGARHLRATDDVSAETPPDDDEDRPRRHWYGWQILAGDATVMLLGSVAFYGGWKLHEQTGSGASLCALGPGAHLLSGPLVHVANDRPLTALGSFGMRLLGDSFGFTLGGLFFAMSKSFSNDGVIAFGLGFMIGAAPGIIATTLVDSLVLARKPIAKPKRAGFLPTAWPERGGASVGLVGEF